MIKISEYKKNPDLYSLCTRLNFKKYNNSIDYKDYSSCSVVS